MTRKLPWRRFIARKLLRHCTALLPADRFSWAEAMRTEMEYIADDHEALRWALGSLRACLTERMRASRVNRLLSAHALGILWIVVFIVSSAYNAAIALAARLGYHRTAAALGWWMKDFQYDRFAQYSESLPVGLFVLMALIVLLFAASLNLNLRRRAAGFTTFCCAVGLSLMVWLYQLGIPAYLQAISPWHRWRIGICFALTASVLGALHVIASTPTGLRSRVKRNLP